VVGIELLTQHTLVMAGLDPAIHALNASTKKDVDARVI
jgi:hypothetical protein